MTRKLGYPQRFLVWMVAIVASVDTLFNAIHGVLDRRLDVTILWIAATALLFPLAAAAEKIKIGGGE